MNSNDKASLGYMGLYQKENNTAGSKQEAEENNLQSSFNIQEFSSDKGSSLIHPKMLSKYYQFINPMETFIILSETGDLFFKRKSHRNNQIDSFKFQMNSQNSYVSTAINILDIFQG